MDERIILVPASVGAAARKFYVRAASHNVNAFTEKPMYLKPKSYVDDIKCIAQGQKIKDVKRLIQSYPISNEHYTEADDWCKMRGTAIITDGENEFKAEVHWYECPNIGKIEFKVKRYY